MVLREKGQLIVNKEIESGGHRYKALWKQTRNPMGNYSLLLVGLVTLLLQAWSGEASTQCKGFDPKSYTFGVPSLVMGRVLGRVHFDCSGQKNVTFEINDPRFKIYNDGTVSVQKLMSPESHANLLVTARSEDEEWDATVTVLINRKKKISADNSGKVLIMRSQRSSGASLRRKKREWIIPTINFPENERGDYPKFVIQIKSSRQKEIALRYFIKGPGADEPPRGLFTIKSDDGSISVHSPLDREQKDSYKLTAIAKDLQGVIVEQPVDIKIKVIDQNDNRPEFTTSTFYGYIAEGATPGTSFMNVTATDKDQPDTANGIIRYSIVSQTPELPSSQMFTISSETGLISVQSSGLDRELVNKYTLIIRAADLEGAGMFTDANAIITVTDTNDNAPQFETKEVVVDVRENENDYDVTTLSITDKDEYNSLGWKANYSIVFGNERQQFAMETDLHNNGVLKLVKPLDYERSKLHRVIVEVKNQIPLTSTMPLSSATVIINVLDVNEAPIFDPETKRDTKPENLPIGSTVTSCSAKDPDNAQDQIVRYRMGSDPAKWFEIESDTGIIKLVNEMDRESPFVEDSKYTATILAYDNGSPSATGTGTLILQLEDVNDNPPIAIASTTLVCNHNPLPVNVTIMDKDIPPNTFPYVVQLTHGAESNWTIKHMENAEVVMLLLQKTVEPGRYEVPLKITDSGRPPLSQLTGLSIEVCDCHENGGCKERIAGAAFGISGILAILGAILALLLLVLLLLLFVKKRRNVKKEPLLPEEDVRDNIYYYDEEGGGEEDQDYDLSQLHRGLDARPEVVRNDVAPLLLAPQYRPRPANPDEIGNFIDENLKTADNDPTAPPYDSLLVFDYEGGGSEAESLSSVNSSTNSDLDQDYDHLNDWGPRFKKLAEMYGGGEE
ncbi:B-cadherin isoform X2 [Hemiscyllium ocellatum]|uniref:B-cadherin isoform X2 n=1 Tax=Hemiscyllium ocellatum TaxID=170820 RepID=UPI0029667FBC|nr:B-cadherin isoform X2 [Hemiscyllium ocellatum]